MSHGGGEKHYSNSKKDTLQIEKGNISSHPAGTTNINERKVTLRTVRQFMKMGRSRSQHVSKDSSTEDEGR